MSSRITNLRYLILQHIKRCIKYIIVIYVVRLIFIFYLIMICQFIFNRINFIYLSHVLTFFSLLLSIYLFLIYLLIMQKNVSVIFFIKR